MGQTLENDFDSVLAPYLKQGLWTHSYVELGHLETENPIFSHQIFPDSRRIFDLASLTKALSTTPLVYQMLEEQELSYEATVGECSGGWALDKRLQELTIASLLKHRSGLPAWRNFYVDVEGEDDDSESRLLERLNHTASQINPGRPELYSDVGFLLLGFLLVQHGKRSIADQFKDYCVTKLGSEPQAFPLGFQSQLKSLDMAKNAIPTAHCALRHRDLVGETHDENAWSLGSECAHAGLFSTGEGLVAYLKDLWNRDRRVISENLATIQDPPMLDGKPNGSLMGWRQGADPSSETFADGLSAGHMGFTGTAFWVRKDVYYGLFLTNRICSGRVSAEFKKARRDVFGYLARQIPSD